MTPAERSPSPTPTVTDSSLTGNADAWFQMEPQYTEALQHQRRTKEKIKIVGCEDLPPHLLDHGYATKGMPKTYLFGIHCSTEQLETAVVKAQLMTEEQVIAEESDPGIYEATRAHMNKLFRSPFIHVKVAYSKEGQRRGAVLVSIYSNHEVTKATKRMEKSGVTKEAVVEWIQGFLAVDAKDSPARWYEPVVSGANRGQWSSIGGGT